jgi:hypothetical protein
MVSPLTYRRRTTTACRLYWSRLQQRRAINRSAPSTWLHGNVSQIPIAELVAMLCDLDCGVVETQIKDWQRR